MWHFGNSKKTSSETVHSHSCRKSATFSDCYKSHNKAIYDTSATAGNHTFPFLPYYCVHSSIATNRITKPFVALQQQQENLVRNRTFPFLPYYCLHSPIVTNRTTMPFMALRQQQEYLVCNRTFPFLPYYCIHSPNATNRITKPFTALRQQQEYPVRNHIFPFLPYICLHSSIATNCITKLNTAYPPHKCKDGRHEKSCLPFIVSIVYPIKPHCKAK